VNQAAMKSKAIVSILVLASLLLTQRLPAQTDPPANQTDLLEILVKALNISVKEKPPGEKRVSFSVVPTTSSTGGKRIFVSAINAAFILGHKDSTNFSSIYFLPYTNFSDNIGFGTKQNLFTSRNVWNLPGEIRLSKITQYTYGLGSHTNEQEQVRLNYNNIRVYLDANRKLASGFFAGFGFDYDDYYNISSTASPSTSNVFEKYGIGTGSHSSAFGINFNLLYDNRKNSINPADGWYSAVIYRVNPLVSNEGQWSSIYLDVRKYFRLNSSMRKIMAVSGFYWGADGEVPYLNLPGTQLEFTGRSGRGYALGRFRGKQMLYVESEYRFDISSNGLFGAVLFANAQSLSDVNNEFTAINPAGGFGARIKFNKESDTNLTLDFGFGENSFGFYIGLGEFF
jgi:outer membrane protein assembly factor BamA